MFRETTFGNVLHFKAFYYDKQRWYKNTSKLERTRHNAYSIDGKVRYKWFRNHTPVQVEMK